MYLSISHVKMQGHTPHTKVTQDATRRLIREKMSPTIHFLLGPVSCRQKPCENLTRATLNLMNFRRHEKFTQLWALAMYVPTRWVPHRYRPTVIRPSRPREWLCIPVPFPWIYPALEVTDSVSNTRATGIMLKDRTKLGDRVEVD